MSKYYFTYSSHNFDVDIDLNVASPNNATNVNVKPVVRSGYCQFLFLSSTFVLNALKPQLPKMKPFTPYNQVHVKKDNGPKKSLNLADYKKKRGLI